jgi:hypothetical protein
MAVVAPGVSLAQTQIPRLLTHIGTWAEGSTREER